VNSWVNIKIKMDIGDVKVITLNVQLSGRKFLKNNWIKTIRKKQLKRKQVEKIRKKQDKEKENLI